MSVEFTKKELASIAGYTYRRLHDIDTVLPANGKLFVKGEGGKYDLAIFVQRWVKYNIDVETADDATLDEVKAIHERVKTRKTELEVAHLEGKLVDVQEVCKLWTTVASTVTQNLLRLPSKIAPQVTMMDNVEVISSIIDAEVRDILTNIADTPLPQEAMKESAEETSPDGEVCRRATVFDKSCGFGKNTEETEDEQEG